MPPLTPICLIGLLFCTIPLYAEDGGGIAFTYLKCVGEKSLLSEQRGEEYIGKFIKFIRTAPSHLSDLDDGDKEWGSNLCERNGAECVFTEKSYKVSTFSGNPVSYEVDINRITGKYENSVKLRLSDGSVIYRLKSGTCSKTNHPPQEQLAPRF